MKRLGLAFALSALIHAALFVPFFFFPSEQKPPLPERVIRVSLRALPAKAEAAAPRAAAPSPAARPEPRPAAAETPRPPTPKPIVNPAPPPEPKPAPAPKPKPVPKPQPKPAEPKRERAKPPAETRRPERTETQPPPAAPTQPTQIRTGGADAARAQGAGESARGAEAKPAQSAASSGSAGIVDAAELTVVAKKTPDYPMISRRRRDEGTVVLLIRIEAGRVTKVDVERSSGHKPLDESAARAVREWRFDTTGYGEAVTARVPFVFTLK